MDVLIKTIKLIMLKVYIPKVWKKSIGDVGAKKGHNLMFLIRYWHSN
jgi:hypothetical protein